MLGLAEWTVLVVALAVGAAGGYGGHRWWMRRVEKARRRIPRHWPLDPRSMANSDECRVWRWLIRVFFDHYVMIKVPVTRFTFPRGDENSVHWFNLLSGVYCTFTICGPDGHVVGCIDVPGRNGLSRSNQKLKLTLLSQCGIAYWVIRPGQFPTLAQIRADILGDTAGRPGGTQPVDVSAAHQNLRAAIDRQRLRRLAIDEAARAEAQQVSSRHGPESLLSDSGFASSGWQQPNSFIAPLDSRPAKLS